MTSEKFDVVILGGGNAGIGRKRHHMRLVGGQRRGKRLHPVHHAHAELAIVIGQGDQVDRCTVRKIGQHLVALAGRDGQQGRFRRFCKKTAI